MVKRHSIWIGVGLLILGLSVRMAVSAPAGENPPLFSANTVDASGVAHSNSNSVSGTDSVSPQRSVPGIEEPAIASERATLQSDMSSLEKARQKEDEVLTSRKGKAGESAVHAQTVSRSSMPSAARMVLSLLAVLALILLGTLLLRRFSVRGRRIVARSGVEILSRTPINSRQSLFLVKIGSRILVLGVSPNHIASLDTIEDSEELSSLLGLLESQNPSSISQGFERMFNRQSREFDSQAPAEFTTMDWNEPESRMAGGAKHELSALLEKVKGLSRIRFRSGTP